MSLTSFLKIPDVREKFKQQFVKPKIALQKEILAPPRTQRYGMVGTAFDYLLRFHIKYHNPEAIETKWIAEYVTRPNFFPSIWIEETDETTSSLETEFIARVEQSLEIITKATKIVEHAKSVYSDYLETGNMTDELIKNSILLAQVDPIFRAGYIDDNLGVVDKEDVADLRRLISLVKLETFRAENICLLNPTFGEASRMVGGADADLIIDHTIIDIKTTKGIQFTLDHFLQLIGY